MNAADDGTAIGAELLSFGLMSVGKLLLALPIDTLREVIACPDALDPLPTSAPSLCGAVRLRGLTIPVLELRAVLGAPPAADGADARSVIVLMRCQGWLLGLRVDAVRGMADVASGSLHALRCVSPGDGAAGATGSIATHTFEVDGRIATVLDAGRIASLPGVPTVVEPSIARPDRGAGRHETVLLFRSGPLPLGIAASSVDATLPRATLRASSFVNRQCRGVVDHHGHEVPVIDTLGVLGLGTASAATESALVVLRFPKGRLALMLDDVKDIVAVGPDDILPLPPLGLATGGFFRGMIGQQAGADGREQHLLLDHEGLFDDVALATLASLSRPKAAAGAVGSARSAMVGRAYLTYLVGIETASPLTQLAEILDHPRSGVLPMPGGREGTLGVYAHRGAAVPLVCLSTLLGRRIALDIASARVLIVACDGQRVGFVVQALCSIETASWEQPAAARTAPGSAGGMQPLIEIGKDGQRRTLPRLDLLQMARALLADNPAAEAVVSTKDVGRSRANAVQPADRPALPTP